MDENVNNDQNVEQTIKDNTQDYIDTINQLKSNSVSKEAYEKLREQNVKLIHQLSTTNPEEKNTEKIPTEEEIQKYRNDLASGNLSNMKYIETALKLRDAVFKTTGRDCFTSFGRKNIKDEDFKSANKSAEFYKECLEKANGNESLFNAYLSSGLYNENQ